MRKKKYKRGEYRLTHFGRMLVGSLLAIPLAIVKALLVPAIFGGLPTAIVITIAGWFWADVVISIIVLFTNLGVKQDVSDYEAPLWALIFSNGTLFVLYISFSGITDYIKTLGIVEKVE